MGLGIILLTTLVRMVPGRKNMGLSVSRSISIFKGRKNVYHFPYTVDNNEVVRTAKAHGSGDSDLFSSALSFLGSNKARSAGNFGG